MLIRTRAVGRYTSLECVANELGYMRCALNLFHRTALIHNMQSTHAASGALGINAATGSGSWAEAVSKDTCVPDNYARTNLAEVGI